MPSVCIILALADTFHVVGMGLYCLLVSVLGYDSCEPLSLSRATARILVYTPQILENYQLQSGEGLSVLFVLIWLAGDICNLLGAGIAGLIPTVIILAIYVRRSILSNNLIRLTVYSTRYVI
jgi:PQ loop repeat